MRDAKILEADIVGIGEHAHGELLSWTKRIEVVQDWVDQGYKVIVLTENLDYYVQGMREEVVDFRTHRVNVNDVPACTFTPCLMPFCEYTRDHYDIMKYFAAMDRSYVTFYGIDVALLDYPYLFNHTNMSPVKGIIRRHRHAWHRVSESNRRGMERNRLNALTIILMARMHPGHKIAYFAQNEHIAFDSETMRSAVKIKHHDKSVKSSSKSSSGSSSKSSSYGILPIFSSNYVTEGAILKRRLGSKYVSIGTFAPVMYNAVWNSPGSALQTLRKSSRMGYCRLDDFDQVVKAKQSGKMDLLCCSVKPDSRVPNILISGDGIVCSPSS